MTHYLLLYIKTHTLSTDFSGVWNGNIGLMKFFSIELMLITKKCKNPGLIKNTNFL